MFNARKNAKGNYALFVNGAPFGSLVMRDGRVVGGTFMDPEVRDAFRRILLNTPAITLHDYLAVARKAHEAVDAWIRDEMDDEMASERAFEAQAERAFIAHGYDRID